jgi:hypothetical protein
MQQHSFSIVSAINPLTGQPFGSKYAGQFVIRRPSLADKQMIQVKKAATMSVFGYANEDMISAGTRLTILIFSQVTVTAEDKLPDWFNPEKMYEDDDEAAMHAVSLEVNRWLDTFRPVRDPAPGGGGGQES